MSVNIKAALVSHLFADDTVRALLGDHIYQDVASADIGLPYLTIEHVGATPMRHLSATSGNTEARLQINGWGSSRTIVDDIADAVREALDHYIGTLGTAPNEATVGALFLERNPDVFIPPKHGGELGTYGVRQTATVEHVESVPVFA